MRTIAIVAALTFAITSPVSAAPGRSYHVIPTPVAGDPAGWTCGMHTTSTPGDPTLQTGFAWGGPMATRSPTSSMTMTCTIQVGPTGATHAGPNSASVSANGTGQVTIPPTPVAFRAREDTNVYLCTSVVLDGTVYYWDAVNATWSTSNSVECVLAIESDPLAATADFKGFLDSVLCPILVLVFPPDGDVPGVWDCPPYGT